MPGLQLAADPEHVLNVATGELLDLAQADTIELAAAREALAELDRQRKTALAQLDAELVSRADEAVRSGDLDSLTFTVGDYRIEVDAPTKRSTETAELRAALLDLAGRGELDLAPAAVENAFIARTTFYRHIARWNNLARQAPEIELLLDDHSSPARRYAKVTRFRPAAIEATATEDPQPEGLSHV